MQGLNLHTYRVVKIKMTYFIIRLLQKWSGGRQWFCDDMSLISKKRDEEYEGLNIVPNCMTSFIDDP